MGWSMLVQNSTHVSCQPHFNFLLTNRDRYVFPFSTSHGKVREFPQPPAKRLKSADLVGGLTL